MQTLMKTIGYRFRNESLLLLALTHPSSALHGQEHNQRLEFLGDAVLQLCASDTLYKRNPTMHEGELSRLRASLVQESSLHRVALKWDLGSMLRLGQGEESSGGREKPSILADAVEAVLGAVYLDAGLPEAMRLVRDHILSQPPPPKARDYKTELQELTQKNSGPVPTYTIIGEDGPPHRRVFTACVSLHGETIGTGSEHSKKAAEQAAAKDALTKMTKAEDI